jgi:site-specific DNA-methyltransferase (adenine-specific)
MRIERIGNATLYLGDCLTVLPTLAKADAVITDPPYINLKGGYVRGAAVGGVAAREESESIGDEWGANLEWCPLAWELAEKGIIVFCSHSSIIEIGAAFPGRRAVFLTWHKTNSAPTGKNVPRFTEEYAWGIAKAPGLKWDGFKQTLISVPKLAAGCMASPERELAPNGSAAHPTQKPLAVMNWIIGAIQPSSVIDPFMGSGTTGVACVTSGRPFVGIEIHEPYFDIACERITNAQRQERLFA